METIIKFLLLLLVSTMIGYSGVTRENNTLYGSLNKAAPLLLPARSSESLEGYFKNSLIKKHGVINPQGGDFMLASTSENLGHTSSFSTTTVQENGIGEGDRIKTDGKHLFVSSVNTPSIKVFRAEKGYAPKVGEFSFKTQSNDTLLSNLYLRPDKQQLVALAGYGGYTGPGQWFSADYWHNRKTELFTIDISTPRQLQQLSKLSVDGKLISSRRIGSTIYLVTRHMANVSGLIKYPENYSHTAFNRMLIASTPMNDMLPKYQLDEQQPHALFDFENCFYADGSTNFSQQSIISLLAVDLDSAELKPVGQCFIGDAETVYASSNAMYLATTKYRYVDASDGVSYEGAPTTEIHKFALKGRQTDYVGSASIDGHLGWQQSQKPFRMSEDKGVLRVLTYVGEQATSLDSPARLHILKENKGEKRLDLLSTLPNKQRPEPLGKKGEQIYASRFIKDKGYLVTFRTTDPLYILDLSDPRDPFITSSLEIDGYSDYLQPVGDNYLLGIGKAATAEKATELFDAPRGAWYQGVKMSLIDISDPTAPVEKDKIILGRRGTETAVSVSHHALTSLQRDGMLQVNLPVSLHNKPLEHYSSAPSHPSDYFGWTQDELFRLEINTNRGEMSVLESIVAPLEKQSDDSDYFIETGWQHDRSVIVDGAVYYLKGDQVHTTVN